MREPIYLSDLGWISDELRRCLEKHEDDFLAAEFHDDFKREPWFIALASGIEEQLIDCGVVAFHCTREAEAGEIVSRGLRILDAKRHQAEFLARFGRLFTADERRSMEDAFLAMRSDPATSRAREGKVCLGLAHPEHWGSGCRDLLGIYGGEAVYAAFGRTGPIVDKLREIGSPAVVHFRLDPQKMRGWNQHPVGQTVIWAWHKRLRPDVFDYWCEGYMHVNVPPADILRVERWSRDR